MKGKFFFLLFCCCHALYSAPLSTQQMQGHVTELLYKVNQTQVELDILNEKVNLLQKERQSHPPSSLSGSTLEKRVAALEKGQTAVLKDIKHLSHRLSALEKQLSSEIGSVKKSLRTMLDLLSEEGGSTYTVQSGDSLGAIALKHRVSIKAIREHNNLKSDTIIIGQKLHIPSK